VPLCPLGVRDLRNGVAVKIRLRGANFKRERERAGLKAERVAVERDCSVFTIWNHEAGRATPSGEWIEFYSNLYGCSPAAFFEVIER
jgi:hypothetical protein